MSILKRITIYLTIVTLASGATSCFTGIESTPKITAADVKREKVTVSEEDEFLTDISRQPLNEWTQGKMFYVTDPRISLIFGGDSPDTSDLAGKYITYEGVRDIISVTGEPVAEFSFRFPDGAKATYRSNKSIDDWNKLGNVEVPFTIEEQLVTEVARRIEGNDYYIVTSQWYDTQNRARRGRKFVKVKVDKVLPGTTEYPVRLLMEDEDGKPFRLFMSVGRGLKAPRNFSSLLAFKDPHLKYPLITEETWKNIINGRVVRDMTQDECRLALGNPDAIDRRPGYGYLYEIWSYENGIYLIFEDGFLKSFRR